MPSSAPVLGRHDGRAALLLDGTVQSVAVPEDEEELRGYWPALVPDVRPKRVLVLGLGGGTVVRVLLRRFADGELSEIVGVDDDPRVLALARQAFGLDLLGLRVVLADAWSYARDGAARGERFDLVIVDLFRDGAIPGFVCSRRFLGPVATILAPRGLLTINLNRGPERVAQLRLLMRVFEPERFIATGMNLVVHARRKGLPARGKKVV
jgi:spermidine synthase